MCIRDRCYYDRGQKYYYMKRFTAEMSDKIQDFLDADADFICCLLYTSLFVSAKICNNIYTMQDIVL